MFHKQQIKVKALAFALNCTVVGPTISIAKNGIKRTVLSPIEFFDKNKAGSTRYKFVILISQIFRLQVTAKNWLY